MTPWVLQVILMLKGAMCVVFQRNVIWRHKDDNGLRIPEPHTHTVINSNVDYHLSKCLSHSQTVSYTK